MDGYFSRVYGWGEGINPLILYRNVDIIEGKNGIGDYRIFNPTMDVWMLPDVTVRFKPGRILESGTCVYERDDGGPTPKVLSIVQEFRWIE